MPHPAVRQIIPPPYLALVIILPTALTLAADLTPANQITSITYGTGIPSTQCANGACFTSPTSHNTFPTGAVIGIVCGFVAVVILGVIGAFVRRQRIRDFQRTYLENAQANAGGINMVPPLNVVPHRHHSNNAMNLMNQNAFMNQMNMQNQINMQNQNQIAIQNAM
ncbi:hypothetical protein DFH09DRAFT_1183933 [Mycena vulgaris]|nr:hypothetical protein DFH09DRAFT_1183933 [Mycena vulgaris]